MVKPPKVAIYRGAKCQEMVFVSGFPSQFENLCRFKNQILPIDGIRM